MGIVLYAGAVYLLVATMVGLFDYFVRAKEPSTLLTLTFGILWPITIPFVLFMALIECGVDNEQS